MGCDPKRQQKLCLVSSQGRLCLLGYSIFHETKLKAQVILQPALKFHQSSWLQGGGEQQKK